MRKMKLGMKMTARTRTNYGEVENHKAVQTFWPRLDDLPHQISLDIIFGLNEGKGSGHGASAHPSWS